MTNLLRTTTSGFGATLPMSLVMLLQPSPPPKQITEETLAKAHVDKPDSLKLKLLSVFAHFVFGSVVAAPYSKINKLAPGNFVSKGALYGLGVWATNYFAVLPLLKYHTNGYKMTARQNLVTAVSHVVWGVALAGLAKYSNRNMKRVV